MVLVVGATGMVGGEVVRRLVADGMPVRAMVRTTSDPARVASLRELGSEIVEGDLRDPASLRAACRGERDVIATVSSMPFGYVPGVNDIDSTDRRGMLDLVDAARAEGVERFVYTSFSANLDRPFPLRDAKREVERHLAASGLTYTILRPSCFMEVWLSPAVGFDPGAGKVTIYGTGEAGVSYIAIPDVAAFAVAALSEPGMRDAVVELGGPMPVSQLEAMRLFEHVAGRKLEATFVPTAALDAQAAAATDGMQRSFATLMRCVADGDAIEMGRTATLVTGPLTSVEAFAARSVPASTGV
jgi:NADH dehydrogenase